MERDDNDAYVFICYAHQDSTVVIDDIRRLRAAGINLWYDEGISPGSEWSDTLARRIQGCSWFLYFVSARSIASEHCRRELNFAQEEHRAVLCVELEPADMPAGLRLSLNHRQMIRRHRLREREYLSRLVEALGATSSEGPDAPFKVGASVVDPARGTIAGDGGEIRIEPKVMDVLCLLAARPDEVVSRKDLVDTVWASTYGGDESLSRAISILRKAFGTPCIETVPKRGYRLTATVAPIERVRFSAPATEVPGPAGDTTTQAGSAQPPGLITKITPKRRIAFGAAAALLVAAVVGIFAFNQRQSGPATTAAQSGLVALQPLAQRIDSEQARRFVAGTDTALRHALASAGVAVVSSQATTAAPTPELLVGGTFDRHGERYLATLHIDAVSSHVTLWSWQFERHSDEMIALQSEIANKIAGVLRCGLKQRSDEPGTMTTEVFGLFLQLCGNWGDPNEETIIKSYQIAHRIYVKAPELAASQGFFAGANVAMTGIDGVSENESRQFAATARRAANRALELDPGNAAAFWALAQLEPGDPAHWARTEFYLNKISEPDKDAFPGALGSLVWLARASGRVNEAISLQRRAMTVYPYAPLHIGSLAWLLSMTGRLPEADELLAKADIVWPNSNIVADYRFQIAVWRRPPAIARTLLENRVMLPKWVTDEDIACRRVFIAARAHEPGSTIDNLMRACRSQESEKSGILVRMLTTLGDIDGAYREVEQVDFTSYGATIFLFFPEMQAFRADPRFMPLAKRIGLVGYWQSTRRWPDFCMKADAPYDCKEVAASLDAADHKEMPAPDRSL